MMAMATMMKAMMHLCSSMGAAQQSMRMIFESVKTFRVLRRPFYCARDRRNGRRLSIAARVWKCELCVQAHDWREGSTSKKRAGINKADKIWRKAEAEAEARAGAHPKRAKGRDRGEGKGRAARADVGVPKRSGWRGRDGADATAGEPARAGKGFVLIIVRRVRARMRRARRDVCVDCAWPPAAPFSGV
eukprot:IDg10400t1